jgi:hypothetical protein
MQEQSPEKIPLASAQCRCRGTFMFLCCIGLGACCWLVLFPWLAELPAIQSHIHRNQRLGIDPTAMFYTEVGQLNGIHVDHSGVLPKVSILPLGAAFQPADAQ